ncbi:MAG: class I adenylate-forming enzyme family protein [Flavobacteriaceae bacterium]|nr:class I adenylate-forming enzyme family protein [Flavobacteriaceae bacterium]
MIFWIEEDIEISYSQLIDDLKKGKTNLKLTGYIHFISLLINLCEGADIKLIDDVIEHLVLNKEHLSFQIQTSGTTSNPKSIEVKMSNCIRYVKTKEEKNKSLWGMGYPAGSFASTQVFFQSLINKETIIYLYGMDFKLSDKVFSRYNITNLSCTPTFLSMLLINLEKEYSSVKKITTGGEKMKENLIQSFKKTFISSEYINIYASTETGSLLYSKSDLFSIPKKYKSHIKVENGTLRVHKSLVNEGDHPILDWYDTKDVVEFVNDYQFRFVSRSNGYLNTGGFRIFPSEIENNIMTIKGVLDVHVYGKPNSLLGTIICADIIGEGIIVKKIKTELMKLTEKHKVPQIIRVVNSFEYVSNGKKKLMI